MLTGKQAIFVDEYLKHFNATQAALTAGYSPKTAYNIGWENVRKREISEVISRRLSESAMSADEVLMRLAEHARSNMGDFWDIPETGDPTLNLSSEKAQAKLHLIKKLKVKRTTRVYREGDENVTENTTEVDFDLYDAQAANIQIGKHHKLWTEKVEHDITANVTTRSADQIIKVLADAEANAAQIATEAAAAWSPDSLPDED